MTVAIRSVKDIPEALGASYRNNGLLVAEADLGPEFFDLRSGLAGELLQKFVNYRARLAIVLADPNAHGQRFSELVYEHRVHPAVRFFISEDAANAWLESGR
jgi:uncharacterized protein DUF4180